MLNNFLYCFTKAFFGFVIISISASLSSSLNVAIIGRRPTNSGISPNFNKSCGNKSSYILYLSTSFTLSTFAPNPIDFFPILSPIILSNPSKAPPQINNILDVFICINS